MKPDLIKYSFYCFGNSNWNGIPNRDQHIAFSIAISGFNVYFINEIPSLASLLKKYLRINDHIKPYYLRTPKNLNVITPWIIPTFFRSSLMPFIDRMITKLWFNRQIRPIINSRSVVVISNPVWFYLLGSKLNYYDLVIYDLYDDLRISARNKRAQKYLAECEKNGISKCTLIICSTPFLMKYIEDNYNIKPLLIRNGIDEKYITEKNHSMGSKKIIGLIGLLDVQPCIYDINLLEIIINRFPDCEIHVFGRMNKGQLKRLSKYSNFCFKGFKNITELKNGISKMAVCIIPFLGNEISLSVNPLKLYEYIALGKAVVATDNFDYADAKELIYVSDSSEQFLKNIESALFENDLSKVNARIKYARENTWDNRVCELINNINKTYTGQ